MHVVHPALSTHSFVSNYFPQLPNKSFDMSHDGKTHELLNSFIGTARLSREFLCAMGASEEFESDRLESKLRLAHASIHGNLVALVYNSIQNQSQLLLNGDIGGVLLQPLDDFIIMHKANKEIFDFLIKQLGCEVIDSWKIYNCMSSSFSKQLVENHIYEDESQISKKMSYAIQYSKFLNERFGNLEISDTVISVLSRLSVLSDLNCSPAMRKLAYAHIAQTQQMLCDIFSHQLDLMTPGKSNDIIYSSRKPASLEAVNLKPFHFFDKKSAADYGVRFKGDGDYFRFFDSLRVLFSRQIERDLPLVSPHIAIYCLQNAADKACFLAGAKKYANYGMRAAGMLMSMTRFAATWIP